MAGRWGYRVLLLFVVLAVLRLPIRAWVGGDHLVTPWGDREVTRALDLTDLPVAGAEASGGSGARVPGPALGVLVGVPWALTGSFEGVVRSILLFGVLSVAVVAWTARSGPVGSAPIAALLLAGSPILWEAQVRVWNPAWLGAFVVFGVGAVDRLVSTRDARWMVPAAVALAVAAQLHLVTLLLVVTLLPGILLAGVPRLGRWTLAAVGVVALLYAPTLVDELSRGWTLSAAMREQPQFTHATTGVRREVAWQALRAGLGLEAPFTSERVWGHLGGVMMGWGALWAAVRGLRASWTGSDDTPGWHRTSAMFAISVFLQVAWYGYDDRLLFATRYALAFIPLLVLLGARGLADQVGWCMRRSRAAGVVLGVGVVAVLGMGTFTGDVFVPTEPSWLTWAGQERVRGVVQERMGWSVEDYVANTSHVDLQPDGTLTYSRLVGTLHHLLPGPEHEFPGSGTGPCVTLLDLRGIRAASDGLPIEALTAMFPGSGHRELMAPIAGAWPVVWSPASGRCPAVRSNRYLTSAQERADWERVQAWAGHRRADVQQRPAGGFDALLTWPFDETGSAVFPVRLEVVPGAEGVQVTLRAHALRGTSFNDGMYRDGALHDPDLVLMDGAGAEVAAWSLLKGRVGFPGVLTPLAVGPFERPPGSLRVVFRAVVASGGEQGGPLQPTPVSVELPGVWADPVPVVP